MTAVIEVEGLRKTYRRLRGAPRTALDGLDLSVPEGGVFGFLGPNGSGKTTTIRCLLGLVRPTAGRCRLLGGEVPAALPQVIDRVGSIVEAPVFFPTFSARRNLMLLARTIGRGRPDVDAVLARVGLAERAGDLVKGYSLGMRQRLGIAAALLKDPAVLVLDEPANGLDPAGIKEVRLLLRALAADGRTVFLSSHLLNEVEQTCDAVAIVHRGRVVVTGRVRDVLTRGTGGMVARVADLDAGLAALARAGLPAERREGLLHVAVGADRGAEVTQALAAGGQWVTELRPDERTLEDLFLELTGEPAPPEGPPVEDDIRPQLADLGQGGGA